jgi:hypothetical protein
MKQPTTLAPGLKEFHWQEMANIHLDLCYCRQHFIQRVSVRVSSKSGASVDDLDQLAKVDEALKAAEDALETAKTVLFNFCYDSALGADE